MIHLLNCLFSGNLIQRAESTKLRLSDFVSLSFKTSLTSVTCFSAKLRKVIIEHGTREGKHDHITSKNVT